MSKKEKLQGNVAATTLFVGVGGIGSKIIREVLDLAKNDDLTKTRFVIFDTDVNDLGKADDGISIRAVQTSSPRPIRDYLLQDDDARDVFGELFKHGHKVAVLVISAEDEHSRLFHCLDRLNR